MDAGFKSPAITYSCKKCGAPLGLLSSQQYHPDFYFESGNKGSISFWNADESTFRKEHSKRWGPFWETRNSWGICRDRVRLHCLHCDTKLGYIYDDGPEPEGYGIGQMGLGPSQVVPRAKRFRMKKHAIQAAAQYPALG